jgi:ligand-binding SRPBCC domain-containing protein
MQTHRLIKSVVIAAPIEVVFAFHLKPENLKRITPPNVKVVKLLLPDRIETGSLIQIHTRLHGWLPARWMVEIVELKPPHRLVDVARRSPFTFWRHTHEFRPVAGGTEMIDTVEYQLPLGWFGRKLAEPWLVRPQLEAMFRYRHECTQALLEASSAMA